MVLVRPDPARALALRVPIVGAQTGDTMRVVHGQPGVFYYFRPVLGRAPSFRCRPISTSGTTGRRPKTRASTNSPCRSIWRSLSLRIRRSGPRATRRGYLSRVSPPLSISPLATDSSLSIRAMKAQTGVEAPMALAALIPAVPKIRAVPGVVDFRGTATHRDPREHAGEQYQLMLQGTPAKPAVTGNGTDFPGHTEPLTADAVFEVVVTRPRDGGMPVERVVQVSLRSWPDAHAAVTASQAPSTRDRDGHRGSVESAGVSYQLMSGHERRSVRP